MKLEQHYPMAKSPRVHPTLANGGLQEGLVCGTWLGFVRAFCDPSRSEAGLSLGLTAMGSLFASLWGGGLGGPAAPVPAQPSCAGAAHRLLGW